MHTPAHRSGTAGQAEIRPVRTLGDVVAQVMREENKITVNDICKDLAEVAQWLHGDGEVERARKVQTQILRLRTLETRL